MTSSSGRCCTPARAPGPIPAPTSAAGPPRRAEGRAGSGRGLVRIPGGRFTLGDSFDEGYLDDGETPVHRVELPDFAIGATTVTNAEFAAFVKATGHLTTAEREGTSAVFHLAYSGPRSAVAGRAEGAWWWLAVRGADWRHPEGPDSGIGARQSHPVVHVSHHDASAYAAWAGLRLPTEAEWEAAARGGLEGARYPWGDELSPRGRSRCNIFEGDFPSHSTGADGWLTTAPVKEFGPNGHGLHQMVGNVWEWCADWFAHHYYRQLAMDEPDPSLSPPGPGSGSARVLRGGSYLCHDSYCRRYRVAARSSAPPDSTAANLGFRCAR